jgi:hypothetical protein
LAVKGIGMMCGQIEQAEGMFCRVGQNPQSQIRDAADRVGLAERELPPGLFDAISVRETTLISRTAVRLSRQISQSANAVQTPPIVSASAAISLMLRPTRASWRAPWSRHCAQR